ncbi:hypothetical protein ES332_A11G186800v1 [Gossypium tomentosum]|uniref:Uncharacterized protein n=1 Tax=Gossypium tomentosum TaxID=34277 RepID=A0A5D2NC41_GOSTO|nr:hypothetical protein ES332_A11G186800v1 [Gossypium tomentosum]
MQLLNQSKDRKTKIKNNSPIILTLTHTIPPASSLYYPSNLKISSIISSSSPFTLNPNIFLTSHVFFASLKIILLRLLISESDKDKFTVKSSHLVFSLPFAIFSFLSLFCFSFFDKNLS